MMLAGLNANSAPSAAAGILPMIGFAAYQIRSASARSSRIGTNLINRYPIGLSNAIPSPFRRAPTSHSTYMYPGG